MKTLDGSARTICDMLKGERYGLIAEPERDSLVMDRLKALSQ